jgi:hypothetical protein
LFCAGKGGGLLRALFLQEYAPNLFLLLGLILDLMLTVSVFIGESLSGAIYETLNVNVDVRWSRNAKFEFSLE